MKLIHIRPGELWGYFKAHALQLEQKPAVCAVSGNREIWLSNDDGIMSFTVFEDDIEVASFEVFDEDDIQYQYINALVALGFDEYECDDADSEIVTEDDLTDDDCLAEIMEREDELTTITTNLVYDILGDDSDEVAECDISEAAMLLKEVVCDLLTKRFHMPVYRPMWLVDEDGKRFFEQYPYPSIIEETTS